MLKKFICAVLFCLLFAGVVFISQVHAGANINATITLDLVPAGGQGNQVDDGVISGTVSGQGATIVVEVFAKGVTTPLSGMSIIFDFDTSLVSFVSVENSAFAFVIPESTGANLASPVPVSLPPSGFLGQATFTTIADVTGRDFFIGLQSVVLAETATSSDVITSTSTVLFTNTIKPFPGDLNLDGNVNFTDFLLFVDNFGRTGPAPTPPQPVVRVVQVTVRDTVTITARDTITVQNTVRDTVILRDVVRDTITVQNTIRDTITLQNTVTIRDTITVQNTIRDTITVQNTIRDTITVGSATPQEERARNLLGFWKLIAGLSGSSVLDYYYILGYISDQAFNDGELPVWGGDDWGRRILGGYSKGLSQYTILESNSSYNGFFVFDIQGDKAVGIMYFYDKGKSINDGSIYNLTSNSGRTQGEGFDVHAPKLAIPPELADQGRKVGAIPQEIIDAHDRLKARLDQSDL